MTEKQKQNAEAMRKLQSLQEEKLVKEQEFAKSAGVAPEGRIEVHDIGQERQVEVPKQGVVCG